MHTFGNSGDWPVEAKHGCPWPFALTSISAKCTSHRERDRLVPVEWGASERSPVRPVFARLHRPCAVHRTPARRLELSVQVFHHEDVPTSRMHLLPRTGMFPHTLTPQWHTHSVFAHMSCTRRSWQTWTDSSPSYFRGARSNVFRTSIWISKLFAMLYAPSPDIHMSLPLSDTCLAEIKGVCTSAKVPDQDILDPCSSRASSFESPDEIAISPVAVFNFMGLFSFSFWTYAQLSRNTVRTAPVSKMISQPARHTILSRVIERAKCRSARSLLGLR